MSTRLFRVSLSNWWELQLKNFCVDFFNELNTINIKPKLTFSVYLCDGSASVYPSVWPSVCLPVRPPTGPPVCPLTMVKRLPSIGSLTISVWKIDFMKIAFSFCSHLCCNRWLWLYSYYCTNVMQLKCIETIELTQITFRKMHYGMYILQSHIDIQQKAFCATCILL